MKKIVCCFYFAFAVYIQTFASRSIITTYIITEVNSMHQTAITNQSSCSRVTLLKGYNASITSLLVIVHFKHVHGSRQSNLDTYTERVTAPLCSTQLNLIRGVANDVPHTVMTPRRGPTRGASRWVLPCYAKPDPHGDQALMAPNSR